MGHSVCVETRWIFLPRLFQYFTVNIAFSRNILKASSQIKSSRVSKLLFYTQLYSLPDM